SCYQAEAGIRDFHVTGVQTCALPISGSLMVRETHAALDRLEDAAVDAVLGVELGAPFLVDGAHAGGGAVDHAVAAAVCIDAWLVGAGAVVLDIRRVVQATERIGNAGAVSGQGQALVQFGRADAAG